MGPTGERSSQPFDASESTRLALGPEDAEGRDRLCFSLNLDPSQVFEVEQRRHQPVCVTGYLYGARLGSLLHAGCNVDGVPHGCVFAAYLVAHVAHHRGAGVDAHSDVEVEAIFALNLVGKWSDAVDDVERGKDGPLGVVFVGHGCAEEGQYRIAHQPSHHATVPIDGRREVLEGLIHDLGPLFGVELLGHGGGARHVGEEHGDNAALALHGAPHAYALRSGPLWS